jgi:pilus assembly protein CpaB
MRVARIAVVVVAVLAGVIAMFLAKSMTSSNSDIQVQERSTEPAMKVVEVLTATNDIPLGTSLTSGHFTWRKWPKDCAGSG